MIAIPHTLPHLTPLAALLLVPFFALCDRWVGSGRNGRTVPMLTAVLVGGALAALTLPPPRLAFALIGLLWAIHRSIGFPHNSLAPDTGSDRLATALRYAAIVPIVVLPLALAPDRAPQLGVLAILLTTQALVVTALRIEFGIVVADARITGVPLEHDHNAGVEIASGALFGLALAGYALLTA